MEQKPDSHDWHRLSKRWQAQLEAKKQELENLQRELTGCIGCGCLSMKACYLLNPGDVCGESGTGPLRVTAAE